MTVREFFDRGNVTRDRFPGKEQLPIYLGSGRAGVCLDGYGLMDPELLPDTQRNQPLAYKTACHYGKGAFELDAWMPLYRLRFEKLPELAQEGYSQTLELYTGTLTTCYTLQNGGEVKLTAFFSTKYRDTLSFVVEHTGYLPAICLEPVESVPGWYGGEITAEVTKTKSGFVSKTNRVETRVEMEVWSEGASVLRARNRLFFPASGGRHLIRISVNETPPTPSSIDEWMTETQAAFAKSLGESYVEIPDDFVMAMTARSIYYVTSSFAPDCYPSPPMGWTGYGWPFHFPQDVSYLHPAMLRLGKVDLAKAIVETYRKTLLYMESITKRIYGGGGAMWAWEYPIHSSDEMLSSGSPNEFQYEIHNVAYPARMAYETSLYLKDSTWTEEVAKPVIRASAEFFATHLTKDGEGWSLHVIPSMSQDEFAGQNGRNYLCALYSARYTLETAVKMGMGEYQHFLEEGLRFDLLLDPRENLYKTGENMKSENWSMEKHPVQLNPLVFLPKGDLNEQEINAYHRRNFICRDTETGVFYGWTLGTFWVSASHMEDGEGLYYELHRTEKAHFLDPDSLAFYESSDLADSPYYVTTHGFWLQAVLDAFVSDFSGKTQLTPALPKAWEGAKYHNLHTRDGVWSSET